ncbi:lipoate--protein ligase family protein [Brevibacillus reuszeri]|uniref:lipoate--protein ligase family protein n=1 Tax=Brevibacillus reuszeri TaxID=54915 RepID=UPI000CCC9BDA|nr:biotin--protein ligase [Brevibacillus reuszeri]
MQNSWTKTSVQLLDTVSRPYTREVLVPFSLDEAYARQCAKNKTLPPLVHLWRHERAMVLGSRDAKLPYAGDAIRELRMKGYETAVRQSGGAAVPLGPGVVNLSLVMPAGATDLNPEPFFVHMVELIRTALGTDGARMSSGEVVGAYCPGSYDLAIDGLKFCGIAQRRLTRAVAVQAFVNVEGHGCEYGEQVLSFYRVAAKGTNVQNYPQVQPERMASLAELGVPGGVSGFAARIREALMTCEESAITVMNNCPTWLEEEAEKALGTLKGRNLLVGS